MTGTLIRATHLWGFAELVSDLGGDPVALLQRFHVPEDMAKRPDAFMPYRTLVDLFEATAAELDCPDLGLRLAASQGLKALGPIAVIARNSGTIREAFESISRYLHSHGPALHLSVEQDRDSGNWRLGYDITEPNLLHQTQSYELGMANGMQILRLLGGRAAHPLSMHFRHARQAPLQAYAQIFGCPVKFEQSWCGFWLDNRLAEQRINSADAETHRLASRYLESQFAPGSVALSTRVSELIRRLLPTGQCSGETVAEHLALHPRTLQRRLREEGTRYETLLESERKEQAAHYLAESGLYLSQVTGLLGYTEQSTFNRAFRRWYGTTPKRFRERLQQA